MKITTAIFSLFLGCFSFMGNAIAQGENTGLSKSLILGELSAARADKQRSGNRNGRTTDRVAAKIGPHLKALRKKQQLISTTQVVNSSDSSKTSRADSKPTKALQVGNPFLRLQKDNQVQIYAVVSDTSVAALAILTAAGLDIELTDPARKMVQGWVSLEQMDVLLELENVIKLTAPRYGSVRKGSRNTAGDRILRANRLRQQGFRGQGVRVGIISDGANNWTSARASGDLPINITRYGSCSRRATNPANCSGGVTCNEGTAMAEIIHDIAPDAQLAVASAGTSLEFIQRVNQLTNNFKADIIVDDLGFLAEPYFEDGDIAQAVAAVSSKVLFVSAAGNSADGHYEKNYTKDFSSNLHDFGRAGGGLSDIDMGIIVPARTGLLSILQWNDPYESASSDYDLYLFNNTGIETGSFGDQLGSDPAAIEGFCYFNSTTVDQVRWIGIDKFSGSNKRLEMLISNRGQQQYNDANGSIFGHPGVEGVVAVGAINAGDPGNNSIAFYSSRGPSRIDFPALKNRRKPDLVAIDGVQVTGAGGFPTSFFGTSAAAPHVAGIAAQLMSISSQVQPAQARRALLEGAVDLGSVGFDSTYGYGRVDALLARDLLKYGFNIAPLMLLLTD